MKNIMMKPTATAITSWHPYKEVIYACSACGQSFSMFGDKEKYCHTCGTKVDWQNIMTNLPEPFDKTGDYEAEQLLIKSINQKQLNQA